MSYDEGDEEEGIEQEEESGEDEKRGGGGLSRCPAKGEERDLREGTPDRGQGHQRTSSTSGRLLQ